MIKVINKSSSCDVSLEKLYSLYGYSETKFNTMTLFQKVMLFINLIAFRITNENLLHIVCL